MPMKSQAMNAAMHAAEEGKSTLGIPQSVGKEFVEASHGQDIKSLPKKIGGKNKSPNPGADHIDDYADDDDHDKEARARVDHLHSQGAIRDEDRDAMHNHISMMKKARRPNLGAPVPPSSQIAPKVPSDPRTFGNSAAGPTDPTGGGTRPADEMVSTKPPKYRPGPGSDV